MRVRQVPSVDSGNSDWFGWTRLRFELSRTKVGGREGGGGEGGGGEGGGGEGGFVFTFCFFFPSKYLTRSQEAQRATFSTFELTKDLDKFISFFVFLFCSS